MVNERSIRKDSPAEWTDYFDGAHGTHPLRGHGACGSAPAAATKCPRSTASRISWSTWCSRERSPVSAQTIAREVDAIGGNLDAFTGKETVCFNVKVLDEHVPTALRCAVRPGPESRLCPTKISRASVASSSKRSRWTKTIPTTWSTRSSPRISGKIIRSASPSSAPRQPSRPSSRNTLFKYYGQRFVGGNMVFSAAGNLHHDEFVKMVSDRFAGLPSGSDEEIQVTPKTSARINLRNKKSAGTGPALSRRPPRHHSRTSIATPRCSSTPCSAAA